MPQMMPMAWLFIFLFIMTTLMFFISMTYYLYLPYPKFSNLNFKATMKNSWTWKW